MYNETFNQTQLEKRVINPIILREKLIKAKLTIRYRIILLVASEVNDSWCF